MYALRETTALPARPRDWYQSCRRGLDLAGCLVLLVLTAPLMALAALLIKLTSRGPVVYTQTRLGKDGLPYTIYKIRTMHHDCERHSGPQWSTTGDPRITAVGRFLRKTHLDELPQLWNVLRGDMSLVGPRPERPEFVPQLERAVPGYARRLAVRPGVTGLAQVQLPADTDLDSVRSKLAYDLYYVRHQGALLDVQVLLATVLKVLGVSFELTRVLLRLPVVERPRLAEGCRLESPTRTRPAIAPSACVAS